MDFQTIWNLLNSHDFSEQYQDTDGSVTYESFKLAIALETYRQSNPDRNLPMLDELVEMVLGEMLQQINGQEGGYTTEVIYENLIAKHKTIDFDKDMVRVMAEMLEEEAKDV